MLNKTARPETWSVYERHADRFDLDRGRNLTERPYLDMLWSYAPSNGSILDLGCGSGQPIAAYLIARGARLTGIDAAPTMIEICQSRFPDAHWHVADMRTLSLGQGFDGLVAWDSFFHLRADEQEAMFAIFAAHARPGTALLFTSGPCAGEAIGELYGEPLYHASLSPDHYRRLLADHGFEVLRHVVEDAQCGGHTVWLARFAERAG